MKDKEIKVLEELKKGKTIREAANAASTLEILVKRWIRLGEEGDPEYAEFYKEYKKLSSQKREEETDIEETIDKCVKILEEGHHFKEIPNLLDISESELKKFFTQGRSGVKPYDKYYEASIKSRNMHRNVKKEDNYINNRLNNLSLKELDFILEDNNSLQLIPNKNRKIRSIKLEISNENVKNSLIKLDKLKKVEHKIRKQLNKLKIRTLLGYLDEQDRVLYSNRPRKKIIEKIIKDLKFEEMEKFYDELFGKKPKPPVKAKVETIVEEPQKADDTHIEKEILVEKTKSGTCVICGRKLNPYSKRDKCKPCLRSIHGVNILSELLNYIQPGIPFLKEELKSLGYHEEKVLFSIWVLQDNNLLKKEPNKKYSLVEKEKLDVFIEKWGEYIENKGEINSNIVLSKKCIICKETRSISNFDKTVSSVDGYKDYCKKCKPLVNSARSLKTILNYVKPKEIFIKEDLYSHYEQPFILDTVIFNLIDQNLMQQKGEKYRLRDEDILNDFLEKYYIEEEKRPMDTGTVEEIGEEANDPEASSSISEEDEELKRKMNIVLYYLKEGFSEKEAFNSADLNKSVLITWKNLGRKGTEPYDYFYEEYKKLKNIEEEEEEEPIIEETSTELSDEEKRTKEKMNLFINEIISTKSIKTAFKNRNLNKDELSNWIALGNEGNEFYKKFLQDYSNSVKYLINEEIKDMRIEEAKKLIIQGYSVDEAVEKVNEIDYSKKEEEINQIIANEQNQLIEGIEENVEYSPNNIKNELSYELISQNEINGLSTVLIRGKIKNNSLMSVFDKLREYQSNINKILTNRLNDNAYEIFIELEIEESELNKIDFLNI